MDLLAKMHEAKEAPIVGYTEFSLKYTNDSIALYCFFEAIEDIRYYTPIIRNVSGNPFVYTFTCRNKDGVLKVYTLIKAKAEYKNAKTGFFVDRDFDKLLFNPDIYETDFYSIENFYVVEICLKNIFFEHFQIQWLSSDFEICVNRYKELLNEFNQQILSVNAYLSCLADARQKGLYLPLKIDNKVKFRDCVGADLKSLVNIKSLSFEELGVLFDSSGIITKEEFEIKAVKFASLNMEEVFRGKFQLQFLESFLKRFMNVISNPKAGLCSRTYSTTLQISLENIIAIFNSNAYVSPNLRDYVLAIAA